MKIRTAESISEIEFLLSQFDSNFTIGLKKRISDLSVYAEKLFNNSTNRIAIVDDNIAGFICFYCNDDVTKTAFISQLCVGKQFRKNGIGSALIADCSEICIKLGIKILRLEVAKDNAIARRFYERHAFCYEEEQNADSLYMRKTLM
ncbi:MAG: GNAT family N-acetyltransferase [Treponema sp.]|nr:GNAT family N-acetyltransferase [Treponema sp.]